VNAPAPTPPTDARPAALVDWTPEQYHAQSQRISNSQLADFRASRRRFHAVHVAKTLPGREQTPAMLLGSLVDDLLLLPGEQRFAVAPTVDRRTKAGKEAWAACLAEAAELGQYVVTAEQYETAQAMCASLAGSPFASDLLALAGPTQAAIIWDDDESALPCRALLDKLITGGEVGRMVVDLKTTTDASPEAWSRKIHAFSYHCQAAWYLDAAIQLTGEPHGFAHVVISTTAPYEVAVYELDMRAIELGHEANRTALRDLAACLEADEWLNPYEQKPMVVGLPSWAYPREGVA